MREANLFGAHKIASALRSGSGSEGAVGRQCEGHKPVRSAPNSIRAPKYLWLRRWRRYWDDRHGQQTWTAMTTLDANIV